MFSFTNQLYNVQKSFMKLSIQVYTQTRGKKGGYGHLPRPRLRNPVWFVKKERILRNDEVTPENVNFVKDVVADTYGPPAVIGGVNTYKSLLKVEPPSPQEWKPGLKRTGVIARKIGIYPLWLKDGTKILTTLLHIVDNHVVKYIPPEEYKPPRKRPYPVRGKYPKGCLLVGAESIDPSLYTKEYCGLFERAGIMPKRILARFLISPEAALQTGTPLTAAHFKVGDIVDVRGKTIDRGFQGVVKRWGFKGQPASHGQTKTHRRPGNIGGGGEKGRVWPGKKMPGHMGNRWRIIKGVKIWRINTKYNVLYVSGVSVPGETNSYCYIYDTILPLKRHKTAPHFPTLLESQLEEPLPEDIWDDELHKFDEPTIEFVES